MLTKPVKYTEKYVKKELKELFETLLEDASIVFLGELIEKKPYSMQRISEWASMGDEISETIVKIKDILQSRAATGGLKNKLNPAMTKFHLINNFDWKDKQEIEHAGGVNINLIRYGEKHEQIEEHNDSSQLPAETIPTASVESAG